MSKVLIVEDENHLRDLVRLVLESCGYDTLLAESGEEALTYAKRELPHLILLDVMLPGINGLEVVRRLRASHRTAHIPIIMLTACSAVTDKVAALKQGADDYITKPFDAEELLARVQTHLRLAEKALLSTLTELPGSKQIEQAIQQLVQAPDSRWAVLYVDLDNFKAYNDVYGFLRGNELLRGTARIITAATQEAGNVEDDFVGHIGGDDFVLVTVPARVEALARYIIDRFDRELPSYYTAEDRERGYLTTRDRQGAIRCIPLVSISIAVVTNQYRQIRDYWQVGEIAAELKRRAKAISGSCFIIDRRR